jgi:ComF family protein
LVEYNGAGHDDRPGMTIVGNDWALTLKNLFLPIFCKTCGRRLLTEENGFFCPTCWELSPRITRPFCLVCGRPHVAVVGSPSDRLYPCAACSTSTDERRYRQIRAAAYYQDAVEEAIKLFKFHDRPRLAGPLAELMVNTAGQELDCDTYEYLVPVPLHRVRARARGYNQSRLLALEILEVFPNASLDESLVRVRPTRVQSRITDEAERRANVRGAFAVIDGDHLRDARVLVVDDVVTSAGTVAACSETLRAAGVREVDVLAVALAVRQ